MSVCLSFGTVFQVFPAQFMGPLHIGFKFLNISPYEETLSFVTVELPNATSTGNLTCLPSIKRLGVIFELSLGVALYAAARQPKFKSHSFWPQLDRLWSFDLASY